MHRVIEPSARGPPCRGAAKRAGVSLSTVQDFERGQRTPIANNIAAMRRVIEAAGIRLLFNKNGAAAGIVRQDVGADLSRMQY